MKRFRGVSFTLLWVVACSGSQARPEPMSEPEPAPVVEAPPAPGPAPDVTWTVEPHVAIRNPIAADYRDGTLVALSGSGTVAVYRRDVDAVVSTARVERRADDGWVVCGRRECGVSLLFEIEGGVDTFVVDLASGATSAVSAAGFLVDDDGELYPTDDPDEHEASSRVAAVDDGYDVETGGQRLEIRGITGGGEHAIHEVTVHPRGRGVIIHQRAGVVYVRATGAREVACLDERPGAFTPDGSRVVQGEDGICDPETDAGDLATPEPGYGSGYGYGSSYAATEEEEERTYEDQCSPTDPHVCVRVPYEEGTPLSLSVSGRARRLAGTATFGGVRFLPDGSAVVLSGPTGVRGYELPRGREIRALRRDGVELIEVLHDGSLVLRTGSGVSLLARDGTETHVTDAEVHAEGITQHDDGSLYLCTSGGLSVRERGAAAFRAVSNVPCGRVATLSGGVAVTSGVDGGARTVISLADGRVIGTYGAPWTDAAPPLDAESFARCTDAGTLELLDVATLATRSTPGCDRTATYSADGSLVVRQTGQGVEVERTLDGARIELRVVRAGGRMVAVAIAADGAFWVPRPEDAALVDLIRREDDVIVEALRGSSERALSRHHRPTLLSDFFEGRPLPRAGE